MTAASTIGPWLDPASCPEERPPRGQMSTATRELHAALDEHARATGVAWLHPTRPTIQRDLSARPTSSRGNKPRPTSCSPAKAHGRSYRTLCALRHARHHAVDHRLRALEGARCAVVTDSGMQALALVADVLVTAGARGIVMRQIYNKTRTFFEWSARRAGATITLVDDGDLDALRAAITPATRFILAETFTNPLTRAQDVPALRASSPPPLPDRAARHRLHHRDAMGLRRTLLARGASIVTGSLTKALGGQDIALGGYVATDDAELGNAIMDLLAMRGGILDDERARTGSPTTSQPPSATTPAGAPRPRRSPRSSRATRRSSACFTRPSPTIPMPPPSRASTRAMARCLVPRRRRRRAHDRHIGDVLGRAACRATRSRSTASRPRSTTTARSPSTSRPATSSRASASIA